MTDPGWASVLEGADPHVRELAVGAQKLLRSLLPGTEEESDVSAKLLGFTYQPGGYKGLVAAVAVHRNHVNIMLSRGAELASTDDSGLLEGTGKLARHIKIRSVDQLDDPRVRDLIAAAAARHVS